MYRRLFNKVMAAVLSASLVVAAPAQSVYAMKDGAESELSGAEEADGGSDEVPQLAESAGDPEGAAGVGDIDGKDISKTETDGAGAENAASDGTGTAETGTDETDAEDTDTDGTDATGTATDETATEDTDADEASSEETEDGIAESDTQSEETDTLTEGAEAEGKEIEPVSAGISFPDGFDGFVDDEAQCEYGEQEVLLGAPSSGAVNLDITGTFYTLTAEKILKQINDIRYEACREGVYYHSYGRELTLDDYHPLQWSAALEHGTRIRAIEAAMIMAHSTLGGGEIYDHAKEVQTGFWRGTGENLAWNNEHDASGITYGINQFYWEKAEYIRTRAWSGSTGHYVNLINPSYRYVGVGCCMMSNAPYGWNTIAMQLGIVADDVVESGIVDTTKDSRTGKLTYSIPVKSQYFKSLKITGDASVPKGYQREYSAVAGITIPNGYGGASGTYAVSESSRDAVSWSSSDEGIFTVDGGVVTGVMGGTATLNARVGSVSAEKELTVTVSLDDIVVTEQGSDRELTQLNINRNEVKDKTLAVTYLPADTTDARKATFKSSNTGIVSVDSAGKLTFKKPGTAIITVSAKSTNKDAGTGGTITKTVTVNVTAPVTGIKLNKTAVTLNYTGKTPPTATLGVSFVPADTEYEKKAVFSSSDESIAKVDQNGKITAVAGGEAVITASAYGFTADCSVKVNAPLKALNLRDDLAKLYLPDATGSIEVRLEPLYTSDKEVVFTSSDPGKVRITGSGDGRTLAVTAVNGIATAEIQGVTSSNSDVTIEVSAAGGKLKKTVNVVIAKPTGSVTLSLEGKELSASSVVKMDLGTAIAPKALSLPADAYDTSVVWESSDPEIARVSETGQIVALREGEAVISATSYNAKTPVTASFKVKTALGLTGLKLSRQEISLYEGDSYVLSGALSPEGVTGPDGKELSITYESSDPGVISVSSDGRITALKAGEAVVKAAVKSPASGDSLVEDTCAVLVQRPDYILEDDTDTPYGSDTRDGIWLARQSFKERLYYTGKALKQEDMRIYYGKRRLVEGTDYTLSYKNNVKAAEIGDAKTPSVTVKLKGQYSGSRTYTFAIDDYNKEKNFGLSQVTLSPKKVLFTGEVPDITVNVKLGGVAVPAEYVKYEMASPGAGKVTIRVTPSAAGAAAGYFNFKDVDLKVTGDRPMKDVVFAGVQDLVYSDILASSEGGMRLPNAVLTYSGEVMTEGSDYELVYSKNTKAGTATVTAKGLGRYTGSVKKSFKILPNDGAEEGYGLEAVYSGSVRYTKGGVTPDIKLKDADGRFLKLGTDYTVSIVKKSNQAPGVMICTLTGKGNYKGYKSDEIRINILQGRLSDTGMTVTDKAYTTAKNGWKSSVKLTDVNGKVLKAGQDYEKELVYYYKGETPGAVPAPGTIVYVTAIGKGFYQGSAITGSYRIFEKNISKVTVVIEDMTYTGAALEPGTDKIHLYASASDAKKGINELTPAENYYSIVGYSSNIRQGNGQVILRGRGSLGGTRTCKFKILKKDWANTKN